ncbi:MULTISPECIES: dynamin family protein [Cyanophyceae]|uniref:Dynamin family protein n=1 Tax=Leptolyngbya subtilissima DQ-A4 TaxID=2933933 RepID=A0ABV0K4B0_9CYAN|nr:dynamin family protein [Nodosilinea sp. FACHB-141]MBD2113609.1 dynamin family protein [Nodosilinea sp. FACHB-141]
MASQIIDKKLHAYRDDLDRLLERVQALATTINNPNLQRTTHNLRRNINEPFLFVVVGEVKAGKSSFVNALLDAEVCATDIEPCTDSIQQIIYAEQEFVEQVEPNLRKIGRPIPILQDISIVDTPGTNTVVAEHQIITERYIPNSDLTFFVLFGKNPYQKSAWDFLDFVSAEWRKKVVFILQQADLLRPPDLQTNIERVKEYAYQKQIKAPIIFPTSAALEQEGDTANSGFEPVRQYIQAMVSSGESYKIKLRSVSQTTQQIIDLLNGDVEALSRQLVADRATSQSIRSKIDAGRGRSRYEINTLADRLAARYEIISARIKRDFRESLSVTMVMRRSFVGIFNQNESMQAWVDEFQERCARDLRESLEEASHEGAQHFVDGIRQLFDGLNQDLESVKTQRIESSHISLKVLERRQEVIESVMAKVKNLMADQGLGDLLSTQAGDMATEIVGGAIMAVAGTILHILEFAVAEAILSAIGIAFAGVGVVVLAVGILWQRNRIVAKFEQALDSEKDRFQQEVASRLNEKLGLIYEEVERIFTQFYDYVAREEEAVQPVIDQYTAIKQEAAALFSSKVLGEAGAEKRS